MTTRPTASTFREPILRVLGNLTGMKAGVPVPFSDAVEAVCADTGIGEHEYGDDTAGNPRVRIWINECFNKKIRKEGLGDKPQRGMWSLTDDGVQAAALIGGGNVAPDPRDADDADDIDTLIAAVSGVDADDEVEDTPTAPPVSDGGIGVSWSIGVRENAYNDDPYIRGIAVEATKCFGLFSDRSKVCEECGISGACKGAVLATMGDIAAKLRKRDEEALKPKPDPKTVQEEDDDLDIDDIIEAIESDTDDSDSTPTGKVMEVPADTKCRKCGKKIARKSQGYWVRGDGMYHLACAGKT